MEWIRLNKKANNLPDLDFCHCWLRIKDEDGSLHTVMGKYNGNVKRFYWHEIVDITHYMVIEKPKPPTK